MGVDIRHLFRSPSRIPGNRVKGRERVLPVEGDQAVCQRGVGLLRFPGSTERHSSVAEGTS